MILTNKKMLFVALLVLLCMVIGAITPMVFAQGETEPEVPVSLGWIIIAWLVYSFSGYFASGEQFNGIKFAKTFIVTIIVLIIALALKITPTTVATQYSPVLDQVATVILNTAPGITLIYLLEKVWKIIAAYKAKWEKAKELALPGTPGPPKTG